MFSQEEFDKGNKEGTTLSVEALNDAVKVLEENRIPPEELAVGLEKMCMFNHLLREGWSREDAITEVEKCFEEKE